MSFCRHQIGESVPTAGIKWGRKRKYCGRQAIRFISWGTQLLIDVYTMHWGQLSLKHVAGKLAELDIDATSDCPETMPGAWKGEKKELHLPKSHAHSQGKSRCVCAQSDQ